VLGAAIFLFCSKPASAENELKGKHFVIDYHPGISIDEVRKILRHAEHYYDSIARQIGYSRYNNFWTWDDRVRIVVYPDQQTFVQYTGQPAWSRGYASRDSAVFNSRAILTYLQESEFYDGVLPHEIGHLILIDFLGPASIKTPIWFHEGVAQLQEGNKKELARNMMRYMVKNGNYVPLESLMTIDLRAETDPGRVQLLYAQSVSIVDFMISRYGSYAFGSFCRFIRDGLSFYEAWEKAFPGSVDSIEKAEKNWVQSLSY